MLFNQCPNTHLYLCHIDHSELKLGIQYLIIWSHIDVVHTYIGICYYKCNYGTTMAIFKPVTHISNTIVKVRDVMMLVQDEKRKYYKIIKQKQNIQNAMEIRAVNKLLQYIIGDDSFIYYIL